MYPLHKIENELSISKKLFLLGWFCRGLMENMGEGLIL